MRTPWSFPEAQTASDQVIAQRFSGLIILQRLGEGTTGSVFLARTEDGTLVAAKVLSRKYRRSEAYALRFEQEIEILVRLDHPAIVRLLEYRESDGVHCFVMELVEGESLARVLARGPLGIEAAIEIGIQLADALEHAHARGVIHRDLKPANVMLDPNGKPRLLDFGTGKLLRRDGDGFTLTGEVLGTIGYASPEQLAGRRDVDHRADVHALGVLVWQLVTARAPTPPGRGPGPIDAVHPALDAVLARAVARDRDQRFASAQAFAQALSSVDPS